MAPALCLSLLTSLTITPTPGIYIKNHANSKHNRVNSVFQRSSTSRLIAKANAKGNQQNTKPNSMICADCDGNGAVQCSQCKGSGVNSVDVFNGQFKAGDSCWLCGGRKEMLCGNCNGAGFVGGFLSTHDQ
ncbi:hypothetical protein HN51_020426 [Arachis hypogaea]|uniref:BSD2 cysteine rich domain-containing protein n=2 Tax=Arachis TaxID=3817 RepID=A0A445C0V9_ARAHY|nr:protein BUNDLE SHEATH DEFECTIVE 2, chloroplastic [Arachis duranensis]XP_025612058.1 protein SPA, chloroplastic [Arachis hypogaea]QHO32381.1 uncharacterized protein DS421_8g249340 [Arachis hypogaea]RYR44559.1 hypothetical protein Ahy_A08g040879 [Arachis hypogaea]